MVESVVDDEDQLAGYRCDWTKHYSGAAEQVLLPSSVDQVSEVIRYCHDHSLAVVAVGGRTGLVGGTMAEPGQVLLDMSKLNHIQGLHEGVLDCQAGCILQELQDYAAKHNRLVPVDLGSKGTCQIGGNLATNAGGVYYAMYGSLMANVLGVQLVDGRGETHQFGSRSRKDNTGYKLHPLMLGSEGTLGVITNVLLACPPAPQSVQSVLLAVDREVLDKVLQRALSALGEILAAAEWMDAAVVEVVRQSGIDSPIHGSSLLLIETHGSNAEHDRNKLEGYLESLFQEELVLEGIMAESTRQQQAFWKVRESCNPAVGASGYTYKYDLSLPLHDFGVFGLQMAEQLQEFDIQVTNWGHVLDGNLHFNVTTTGVYEKDSRLLERLEHLVIDAVLARGGSISAEHGIGQTKRPYMTRVHSKADIELMQGIKRLFDPKGILNPGKLLP